MTGAFATQRSPRVSPCGARIQRPCQSAQRGGSFRQMYGTCQHWVSTFGVNIWSQHLESTFGVNIWSQHWVSNISVALARAGGGGSVCLAAPTRLIPLCAALPSARGCGAKHPREATSVPLGLLFANRHCLGLNLDRRQVGDTLYNGLTHPEWICGTQVSPETPVWLHCLCSQQCAPARQMVV